MTLVAHRERGCFVDVSKNREATFGHIPHFPIRGDPSPTYVVPGEGLRGRLCDLFAQPNSRDGV
jgi:hypothetical protein